MAGADQTFGVLVGIDDREEVRSEFTVFLFHGEILLVVAHDGDEDFVRQAQERQVETPVERRQTLTRVLEP